MREFFLVMILTLILINLLLFALYKYNKIDSFYFVDRIPILPLAIWITYKNLNLIKKRNIISEAICKLNICENKENKLKNYYLKINSLLILSILFIMFFGIMLLGKDDNNVTHVTNNGVITRPKYGEHDKTVSFLAKIDSNKKQKKEINISVKANPLSDEEITELLCNVKTYILKVALGKNKSFNHITSSLNLVKSYPKDDKVNIYWTFEEDIITKEGNLIMEKLITKKNISMVITANISYLDFNEKVEIPITIITSELIDDVVYSKIYQNIEEQNNKYSKENKIILPSNIENRPIVYSNKKEDNSYEKYGIIIVLFASITLIIVIGGEKQLEKQLQIRENDMIIDYPVMVNKLALLISAGMNIKKAWRKICLDYVDRKKLSGNKQYIYEEMLYTFNEISNGESEIKAYTHFGKRIGIGMYIKLSTLLAQCIQKGNENITDDLIAVASDTINDQINKIKQYSEKMEVKLIFPMISLLAISLGVIIVPALFGL